MNCTLIVFVFIVGSGFNKDLFLFVEHDETKYSEFYILICTSVVLAVSSHISSLYVGLSVGRLLKLIHDNV